MEYTFLVLLAILGILISMETTELLTIFIALEMQAFTFYTLVSIKKENLFSSEGGLKYFIIGAIASASIILATALIFEETGVTNLSEITDLLPVPESTKLFALGGILIIIGLLFKIEAVPFYLWLLDAYQGASYYTLIFIAIFPKLAIIYLLFTFNDIILFIINTFKCILSGIVAQFSKILLIYKKKYKNNIIVCLTPFSILDLPKEFAVFFYVFISILAIWIIFNGVIAFLVMFQKYDIPKKIVIFFVRKNKFFIIGSFINIYLGIFLMKSQWLFKLIIYLTTAILILNSYGRILLVKFLIGISFIHHPIFLSFCGIIVFLNFLLRFSINLGCMFTHTIARMNIEDFRILKVDPLDNDLTPTTPPTNQNRNWQWGHGNNRNNGHTFNIHYNNIQHNIVENPVTSSRNLLYKSCTVLGVTLTAVSTAIFYGWTIYNGPTAKENAALRISINQANAAAEKATAAAESATAAAESATAAAKKATAEALSERKLREQAENDLNLLKKKWYE